METYSEQAKITPQAVDVEEIVLGSMLLESSAILEVIDILSENSFYKNEHKTIYNAIVQLNSESKSIDIITVTNQLESNGHLEDIGGPYFVSQLTNRTSSSVNIESHARIIKEKEIARDLIKIGREVVENAYDPTVDVLSVADHLLTKAYEIGDLDETGKSETNIELLRKLKENIYNAKDVKGITGLTTGIQKKDELFGGYQPTHLIIKAGRPAMGKSADALCEAEHMAEKGNKGLFFSLEMSAIELTQRRVAIRTGISINKLKSGNLSSSDWKIYNTVTSDMMNQNLTIIDTPGISFNQIRKISKKHAIKHGLDFIFIDYLQLIEHWIKGGNREQEISAISRGLKKLAKELNIPVIALAQLSRAVETRGGSKKPILSDLRESGAIEQDADIVQFLYRPEYYGINQDEDGNSLEGKAFMIVAKNRHGSTKDIEMRFIGELTKFVDWEEAHTPIPSMERSDDFNTIPISSQDAKEDNDLPF